jgi:CheY-like chemotaxis protein
MMGKPNTPRSHAEPASQRPTNPNGPRILLVDDSALILKNAKMALERAGYQVVTASNGKIGYDLLEKQAQENWANGKINLVVTDIEMPQMDGFTLIKKLREHEDQSLTKMPVIIHSSLSGHATQSTGMALGANGYVVKTDTKNLVHLLDELLGWKSNQKAVGL